MVSFEKDTTVYVESYKIASFETRKSPYEGHYTHYNTSITSNMKELTFLKGDYLVTTHQPALRYLLETLEP